MRKCSTARLKSLLLSNQPPENFQRIEQVDSNGAPLVIVLDEFGDGAVLLERRVHRIRFRTLPNDLFVEPSDFEKIDAACRQITTLPMHVSPGVVAWQVFNQMLAGTYPFAVYCPGEVQAAIPPATEPRAPSHA